jgi:hypothetical protein
LRKVINQNNGDIINKFIYLIKFIENSYIR